MRQRIFLLTLLATLLLSGCTDWPRGAAERGDAEAQYNLAVLYEEGVGVRQDYRQSVYWYQRAADQGMPEESVYVGADVARTYLLRLQLGVDPGCLREAPRRSTT